MGIIELCKNLDSNHLLTMCLTGSIGELNDWPAAINIPELDFIFWDICLFDILYAKQPIEQDYLTKYINYPIFLLGKPIVPQLAFTSAWLDEKFAADYKLQGQIFQEAIEEGFQSGIAGATVFSWGSPSDRKQFKAKDADDLVNTYLTYDATNESIVIPLTRIAKALRISDRPKPVTQYIQIRPQKQAILKMVFEARSEILNPATLKRLLADRQAFRCSVSEGLF